MSKYYLSRIILPPKSYFELVFVSNPNSAYYEGALTMFFSTEVTATFESITETIRSYLKWKLNIRESNETVILSKSGGWG